jgi:hypothetical protein
MTLVSALQGPATTSDLWAEAHVERVMQMHRLVATQDKDFSTVSYCSVHTVNSIPPRVDVDEKKFPEVAARNKAANTGLVNFFPVAMHGENIGSNAGLMALMRARYDKFQNADAKHQFVDVVVSDLDIFNRIIKVCKFACCVSVGFQHTHSDVFVSSPRT